MHSAESSDNADPRNQIPDPMAPAAPGLPKALADALAAAPIPQTNEEIRAELGQMEAEAMDSLIAFTNACTAGLLAGVALEYKDGKARVSLLINKKGAVQPLPFEGMNLVDALIAAGLEVHTQLMLMHGKTNKLDEYVSWYAKRQKLRRGQQIIVPARN